VLCRACFFWGGIALALTGWGLHFGTGRFLDLLAQASLPLGLIYLGDALQPAALRYDDLTLVTRGALRLLLMPCSPRSSRAPSAFAGSRRSCWSCYF
jgi:predicted permease